MKKILSALFIFVLLFLLCVSTSAKTVLLGDVDFSGKVTVKDNFFYSVCFKVCNNLFRCEHFYFSLGLFLCVFYNLQRALDRVGSYNVGIGVFAPDYLLIVGVECVSAVILKSGS